jgi:hypothetical protein
MGDQSSRLFSAIGYLFPAGICWVTWVRYRRHSKFPDTTSKLKVICRKDGGREDAACRLNAEALLLPEEDRCGGGVCCCRGD